MDINEKILAAAEANTKAIVDLSKKYDHDMRGDGKVDGYKGIVAEIGALKEKWEEYPSIPWLVAHKPLKSFAYGLGIFIVLDLLNSLNISRAIINLIPGVYIP